MRGDQFAMYMRGRRNTRGECEDLRAEREDGVMEYEVMEEGAG
jgi:hypothetical protein